MALARGQLPSLPEHGHVPPAVFLKWGSEMVQLAQRTMCAAHYHHWWPPGLVHGSTKLDEGLQGGLRNAPVLFQPALR